MFAPPERPVHKTRVPESVSEEARKQFYRSIEGRWHALRQSALKSAREKGDNAAQIPDVQQALDQWLVYLFQNKLTGGMTWSGVELVNDKAKALYGWLNVIRFDGPTEPGVGVAAWLSERLWRPADLENRIAFFDRTPCPIRTLVLFRKDGERALSGVSGNTYEEARKRGRDVRVEEYREEELASLLAFPRWLQAVRPDLEELGPVGREEMNAFVLKLSERLLKQIDGWRGPRPEGLR